MNEDQVTKICRYCGKSLPVEAIFCYYCQRELITRPERPDVESKDGGTSWVIWLVIIVAVIAGYLLITSG
jgi:ribosomal protein L40E